MGIKYKIIYRNLKDYKAIVFIDRDGTVNKNEGYLDDISKLKILPKVVDGIRLLNKNKIAVIVITNQPLIGNGFANIDVLNNIHNELIKILNKKGAIIDAIYYCPHHPDAKKVKYRIKCLCRKPNILLFKKALSDFGEMKVIGIIGDTTRDVLFGKRIEVPTVIVKTGMRGEDNTYNVTPDYYGENFLDCVNFLLNKK